MRKGVSCSVRVRRRGSDAKGRQLESLVGRERRDCRAEEGGDGQRTTFGKGQVAVTSLMSGMAAPQHGLSPELLQDGHLWTEPTSFH